MITLFKNLQTSGCHAVGSGVIDSYGFAPYQNNPLSMKALPNEI